VKPGSTASTSSNPTGDSPPWTDLSKLGEYIVAQLDDERGRPNLLAHWIAHRLAEHLHEAENAAEPDQREAARAAAAVLVPQLWCARAGWPRGWPPDTAKDFLEAIDTARTRQLDKPRSSLPWLATFGELEELRQAERKLWLYGALLELDASSLQAALDAAPESDADADDIANLRWQLTRREEAEQWLAEHAQPADRTTRRVDRARALGRALAEVAEQRAVLVKRTLAQARRGQRRTRSSETGESRPDAGGSEAQEPRPKRQRQAASRKP